MYCTALFGLQEELECSWRNEGIAGCCVLTAGDIGSVLWPIRSLSRRGLTAGCSGRIVFSAPVCIHGNCLSINVVIVLNVTRRCLSPYVRRLWAKAFVTLTKLYCILYYLSTFMSDLCSNEFVSLIECLTSMKCSNGTLLPIWLTDKDWSCFITMCSKLSIIIMSNLVS